MTIRFWIRTLMGLSLVAGGLLGQTAGAQEALPLKDGTAFDNGPSAAKPGHSLLDAIAKDLRLGFLATPDETTLRLPLAPGEWSLLKGVQPYAMLSPSTVRPITEAGIGLAAPARDPAEDPWKGLGVGAGLRWHLSDRLDLFGQYQFMSLPGGSAPTGSPLLRRETESPGVKGGLSIHF